MNNQKIQTVLKYSFYIVISIYWLRLAYLGLQLYKVETIGQAQSLLDTKNLYLMSVIKNYFAHTKGWGEFILLCLKDISFYYLALVGLWWMVDEIRNDVEFYISATIIVPLLVIIAFLGIMAVGTLTKGLNYGNILGIVLMIVSLLFFFTMMVKMVLNILRSMKG